MPNVSIADALGRNASSTLRDPEMPEACANGRHKKYINRGRLWHSGEEKALGAVGECGVKREAAILPKHRIITGVHHQFADLPPLPSDVQPIANANNHMSILSFISKENGPGQPVVRLDSVQKSFKCHLPVV